MLYGKSNQVFRAALVGLTTGYDTGDRTALNVVSLLTAKCADCLAHNRGFCSAFLSVQYHHIREYGQELKEDVL